MKHYRVQIPEDGFPIEWITITDEGSVIIHFGTPVLLNQLTLDDRDIINLSSGLCLLIGTGQTVELKMKLANEHDPIADHDEYAARVQLLAEASALVASVEKISTGPSKVERLLERMKKKMPKR